MFGPGTFRSGKGELKQPQVVKIDPKGMKLYFVDNAHLMETDEVKFLEPIKLTKLIISNKALFENAYRHESAAKNWMDKYKDLEEINDHSGALVLLAERYGTKHDIELAKAIALLSNERGEKIREDLKIETQIRKRLWPKAIKEFDY